jgi:dGTPase
MLSAQVYDVIESTQSAIGRLDPAGVDAVRAAPPLVQFSETMASMSKALKHFLTHNLYRHPQVLGVTSQAKEIVRGLFAAYTADPGGMPADFASRRDIPRSVADYIAGMTDRFAMREHERLTGRKLLA